jgi:hypothetical protein
MIPPYFAWLPLAIIGLLVVDLACLLAAAWIVTAWGKRRDKRLGRRVSIALKSSSEKEVRQP